MGFQDRPYHRVSFGGGHGGGPGRGFGGGGGGGIFFPAMTPMVKKLVLINIGVFIAQQLFGQWIGPWFAASGETPLLAAQLWRLLTFQFLHAGIWHIFANMLGLYFFGGPVERAWGSRRFLVFYLVCGGVGGAIYVVSSLLGAFGLDPLPLVGASGGVLGVMTACAILFPQIRVLVFFMIPVPIRVLVGVITAGYFLNVIQGGWNAGGDVCHLGGIATAFIWVMFGNTFRQLSRRVEQAQQANLAEKDQQLQYEVDRILAKVHDQGIHSLSPDEKRTLQKATEMKKHR